MRAAAEERALYSPMIFMRLAALYMAGAPIGQKAETLGMSRGSRLLDGAASNLRQLERAAARNRGYELTNENRLVFVDLSDALKHLLKTIDEYHNVAYGRRDVLGGTGSNCEREVSPL